MLLVLLIQVRTCIAKTPDNEDAGTTSSPVLFPEDIPFFCASSERSHRAKNWQGRYEGLGALPRRVFATATNSTGVPGSTYVVRTYVRVSYLVRTYIPGTYSQECCSYTIRLGCSRLRQLEQAKELRFLSRCSNRQNVRMCALTSIL